MDVAWTDVERDTVLVLDLNRFREPSRELATKRCRPGKLALALGVFTKSLDVGNIAYRFK